MCRPVEASWSLSVTREVSQDELAETETGDFGVVTHD